MADALIARRPGHQSSRMGRGCHWRGDHPASWAIERWERHPWSNPEHPRGVDVDDRFLFIEMSRDIEPI